MPAVTTQQLATSADLNTGPSTGAFVRAIAVFDAATQNVYLRRASGRVLAAYAKRMPRAAGSSFQLAKWGDFTIDLVVSIARFMMIGDRGYDAKSATDTEIRARYDDASKILDEIVDLENRTPRIDPDAVANPDVDDEGPLMLDEGGTNDEASAWAKKPDLTFALNLFKRSA